MLVLWLDSLGTEIFQVDVSDNTAAQPVVTASMAGCYATVLKRFRFDTIEMKRTIIRSSQGGRSSVRRSVDMESFCSSNAFALLLGGIPDSSR
jgi:hypothetical protein